MDTDMNGASTPSSPTWNNTCDFQHHTLRLYYPAPELLSPGKQPIVETPRGVPDREEPELGLLGLSADDLDFFVRFPTAHGITTDGSLGKREHATLTGPQPLNLPACIDRLSTFAGVSELSFVSYVDDWDVITTFHLKTTFYTNFGKLDDKVQIFELASADVAKLIRTLSGQEEWVRQVDDLIHAKSDRSYMSRYRELANWDEDWTLDNEESWLVKWDTNPLAGSRERFAKRIVAIYQAPDGTIMREGLPDLDEFKDEGFYAELPCGHRTWMAENYIHDLRPRDVLTAICDDCEKPILRKKDKQRLGYFWDRLRRFDWEDRTIDWLRKCKKVRNDSNLVEVSSGTLSASLLKALDTFKLPESINPKSLCPTTYPESQALLNKLVDKLKANPSIPAMTPKALFTNLEKLAWQLIEEMVGDATLLGVVLPPGFEDFVHRWMTRAVNDAVEAQADDEKDDDLMDVVTKMDRTKIDPKAAAVETDLDDILLQMDETKLEQEDEDEETARDATQGAEDEEEEEEL